MATTPFVVTITEVINYAIAIEQDFLDTLDPSIQHDDPTTINEDTPLGEALIDAFTDGEFGSDSENFTGVEDRTIRFNEFWTDSYRKLGWL